jgi:glycosyltransferase involved in cell wall biosynthesis
MINVIIPAYNCCLTLGRTLSSLVAQTDENFEVIIVDDCSTEDIKSIVDDYSNKLNITYIRN